MAALAYDSARQRETLREQVKRDGLTGLLNHRACHERLRQELETGEPVAVVCIDLDHFKVINDAHGHAEGDRVLAATAERLRSVVRGTDVVGRLGGEEFVLILPGVDAEGAEDCAERARAALAELTVRGRPLAASAGVAASPGRRGRRGRAAGERRRRAVLGQAHRPRADRPLRARARRARRRSSATRSRRCSSAARPRCAPCSSRSSSWPRAARPATRRSTRFESEPPRGPDEWFAQAHRVGLGEELEALALRAALAVPGRPEGTFLAVNVSPRALLSAPVRAALPEDLTGIVVELTEHELFGAEGELETELASLRARGARVALDDAGAGYAGLQQIIRIAPDILKLDRALVHGAHADGSRQALLEALIGFAGTTGAAVCAEGVEDLDDVRALVALDVTYAQGYGLARPGPPWPRRCPRRRPRARPRSAPACASRSPRAASRARSPAAWPTSPTSWPTRPRSPTSAPRSRSAAGILRADDVALMRVDRAADSLVLLSEHNGNPPGTRWPLDDFPATRYVLDHRVPGQVVVGDEAGDPAELAELEALGMATLLIVPIVYGGRELAVLEVYRTLPAGLHGPRGRPRPRARAAVRRGARPPHLGGHRSRHQREVSRERRARARSRGASPWST